MNQQQCINNALALILLYGYYEYNLLRKDEWCELMFKVKGSKQIAKRVKYNILAYVGTGASVELERLDDQDATVITVFYRWQ